MADSSIVLDYEQPLMARCIVVAPTFYSDPTDRRHALALETCRKASEQGIRLILVDDSPDWMIRHELEVAGNGYVTVVRQKSYGKKGAALREGIQMASQHLKQQTNNYNCHLRTIIAFQEPEKVDMMLHWRSILRHMVENHSDVCAIRRNDQEFRATYPIEQYYSEQFANMMLNTLGQAICLPSLDWTSGPVALDASMAHHWLACNGELWDAQLLPVIKCHVGKANVTSFTVPYKHPIQMKQEEQSNPIFHEKRLYQIKFLAETVGKKLKTVANDLAKDSDREK